MRRCIQGLHLMRAAPQRHVLCTGFGSAAGRRVASVTVFERQKLITAQAQERVWYRCARGRLRLTPLLELPATASDGGRAQVVSSAAHEPDTSSKRHALMYMQSRALLCGGRP